VSRPPRKRATSSRMRRRSRVGPGWRTARAARYRRRLNPADKAADRIVEFLDTRVLHLPVNLAGTGWAHV